MVALRTRRLRKVSGGVSTPSCLLSEIVCSVLFESACKGTLPPLVIAQIKNDHLIAEFGAMRSAAQKVPVFGPSPKEKGAVYEHQRDRRR
jgi:hypothetical protein